MSESRDHDKLPLTYLIGGEVEQTHARELTVEVILTQAGFSPVADYRLQSEDPKHEYASLTDVVKLHEGQRFIALHKSHIKVAVVTTAGTYPNEGFDSVAEEQPINVELDRAAKKLNITNTAGWIASIGGRELNADLSYLANKLSGQVDINWGPPQRGGGANGP
jgi:hypothetical protein